jgi:protein-S-isoprenylcysteine O-methyltransferase Ste14
VWSVEIQRLEQVLAAGIIGAHIAVENRTLQAELPGYAAYARRVRYRLLPGIW